QEAVPVHRAQPPDAILQVAVTRRAHAQAQGPGPSVPERRPERRERHGGDLARLTPEEDTGDRGDSGGGGPTEERAVPKGVGADDQPRAGRSGNRALPARLPVRGQGAIGGEEVRPDGSGVGIAPGERPGTRGADDAGERLRRRVIVRTPTGRGEDPGGGES